MLFLATALIGGAAWLNEPCPQSFSIANTTVSAISQSQQLSLCVAKAVLVKSLDGSLNLVLNSSNAKPSCLVYPNGLSMDQSYNLLASGHVGCWSLYPPSQPITIVNLASSSVSKVNSEIKRFRPTVPVILYQPVRELKVGDYVSFRSSAKLENQRCRMLNLDCQVRFTPISHSWQIGNTATKLLEPKYQLNSPGSLVVTLNTTFKIEYYFPSLTPWRRTYPNIVISSVPVQLSVGAIAPPNKRSPRLVDEPCLSQLDWGC
jgi:hypothetical protein